MSDHATTLTAWFDRLAPHMERTPSVTAHDLVATDVCDRLILSHVDDRIESPQASAVSVVGDRFGGVTLPLLASGRAVRAHVDSLAGERAIVRNAERLEVDATRLAICGLDEQLVGGAKTVAMRLPRALGAIDEAASVIARFADCDVRVVAGARVKYLTPSMGDVLGDWFDRVRATRAAGKSRALIAEGPRTAEAGWPRSARDEVTGLVIVAHGAVFGGATVDIGTRFLLSNLPDAPIANDVVDLGCGTGLLGVAYALSHPSARVIATDDSLAAVASAVATAAANDVDRVRVLRADAGDALPSASADLVLLNPPFHVGDAVTERISHRMFDGAARLVRRGGEVWTVWNSHLAHKRELASRIGDTRQVARNEKFTITASRKSA